MKFSKIRKAFGRLCIKALLGDGTVLVLEKMDNVNDCCTGNTHYSINGKKVKCTGASNKQFAKYFDNFAEMHKKLMKL
jgi:hypothetical protein